MPDQHADLNRLDAIAQRAKETFITESELLKATIIAAEFFEKSSHLSQRYAHLARGVKTKGK